MGGSLAVSLAFAFPLCAAPALGAAPDMRVLFDPRHPVSRRFGQAMRHAGLNCLPVGDDPAAQWFHDLAPGLQSRGHALAGLTTPAVAVAIRMLAANLGMRATFWGDHRFEHGTTRHSLQASADQVSLCEVAAHSVDWPMGLVQAMRASTDGSRQQRRRINSTSHTMPHHPPLTSWVLAPHRPVAFPGSPT